VCLLKEEGSRRPVWAKLPGGHQLDSTISSDLQSLQILDTKNQNSLSLFFSIAFFDLRLYTVSCGLSKRIRSPATRMSHAKMTRLRDCTTMITSKIFMPEAWSPESQKSNEISWDGVFAEHGQIRDWRSRRCASSNFKTDTS
jgi:hypothetical protein